MGHKISKEQIEKVYEENKEGIQKIYEESKEMVKIENIEVSKNQKETQEKLNKICVINETEFEKMNKEDIKKLRKKEKDKVSKTNILLKEK